MDLKSIIVMEEVRNERLYRLEMPSGAPLGEAYDVTASWMDHIVKLINDHQERQKKKEEENKSENQEKTE